MPNPQMFDNTVVGGAQTLLSVQDAAARGAASGYASLDSGAKVPSAQLPDLSATYQLKSEKGAASGYAQLDSGVLVPTSILGSGAASSATFLRGDRTWATPAAAGVSSLAKSGSTQLIGDVTLSQGSNVTLTQSGQDIAIAAAGGGSGGLSTLFDSTLGSNQAAIDTGAGGIAGGASHLRVVVLARTTQAVVASTVLLTFNNDTGNNYDRVRTETLNATVNGATTLAAASVAVSCAGASVNNANLFSPIVFDIPCYVQTTAHKSGVFSSGIPDSAAANARCDNGSFLWRSTAAISRLALTAGSGNLLAGSRVTVYGM